MSAIAVLWASGCLLLADAPDQSSDCVDHQLGEMLGTDIASRRTGKGGSTYDCPGVATNVPDVVISWTAPQTGRYVFSAAGTGVDLRLGVTAPVCGGEIAGCTSGNESSIAYEAQAGEVVHWVVEARNFSDGEFTISVVAVDEPAEGDDGPDDDGPDDDGPDEGGDCPYTEDNECDEPEGTGWCPEGSDTVDCTCPYTQDGDCDEPEGTGLCPEGSDPYDC